MKQPLAIHRRLQLIVLAALVPIGLFAAYFLHSIWQSQQTHRTDEQLVRAKTMAALIESKLESSISQLEVLAGDSRLDAKSLREFHARCASVLAATPEWDNLLLISRDSQILNARLPFGDALPRSGDRPYQQEAFATLRPTVSDLFQARIRRGEGVDVAVPVIRNGQAKYLLLASLKRNGLSDGLAQLVPDSGGVAAIYDRTMRIVSRTRDADAYIGTSASEPLLASMHGAPEGVIRGTTKDGVSVFAAWKVLNNGWAIATGSPTAAADREAFRTGALFLTAWIATLVVVLLMARLLWKSIDRSIATTATVASQLASGQPTAFPASTLVELAGLARSIEVLFERERAARASVEASSKAKDEFLAMLGHELRNPIAAISNASHVLEKSSHIESTAAFANQIIGRQAGVVKRVIDDLLDLGRVLTGKINLETQNIELAACVQHALDALAASGVTANRDIHFAHRPAWVRGDAARLEQIATNLITNAVKHTPPGGRIDVTVCVNGSNSVMRVSDNGDGIGPDALPRIFELFYQERRDLEQPRSGLGVGLTLVRQVALLHEGTVEAASAGVGSGSTFTVKFPAGEPALHAGEHPGSTPKRQSRSILIVDDNADVGATLRLVLEMEGHEIFIAADGATALATLREIAVDVVLVDIGLPQMDGYAVARAIRAEFGRVHKLVALTGYGLPEDVRNAFAAGFDEHLTKPADLEQLLAFIEGNGKKARAPVDFAPSA